MSDPTPSAAPDEAGVHHLEAQRREKREQVGALGLNPYGVRTDGLVTLREAARLYDADADAAHQAHGKEEGFKDTRPVVKVAGRVVLHRDNGKLVWMNLRDPTWDSFQVAVSKRDASEAGFELAKLTDLGDVLIAEGPVMKTKAGETTVWATDLRPASKCLVPPPEKHVGLADVEARYRQRYIDMWSNPEVARTFSLRAKLVSRLRRFMEERGFEEVETPVLQPQAGGAAARPFVTHLNALDIDLYMRIATELHLKRMLVGGMPRVFEVGRLFRNEGVDKSHNPEFTTVEAYQAFGDYETIAELAESLVRELARVAAVHRADEAVARGERDAAGENELPKSLVLPFGEQTIDYAHPFDRVTYSALFERALGFPPTDTDAAWAEGEKRGLVAKYARHLKEEGREIKTHDLRGRVDDILIVNELFEEVAEKALDPSRPTFVFDYPAPLSPLTRPKRDAPTLAERWDLFIGGMEMGTAFTELNDPDVQERKFREQLAGLDEEESTFRTLDHDFLRALKVGMPPAGGVGLGIDRLVMLMADRQSIRDVIPFPFMRPEA
ncbi:MAG: lysine--tRNA ligase [Phycisphaerales bacterium]